MKKWNGLIIIMVLGLILTGCGVGDKYAMSAEAPAAAYDTKGSTAYMTNDLYGTEEFAMEADVAEEAPASEPGGGAQTPAVQDTNRKLIRNVNMEVETETFDELMQTLSDRTNNLGGYIEESYVYNGSNYYGRESRNASMTIRIPAQSLEEFLSSVAQISNVVSRNESVSDVTLQYVDMDSHKKALQAEHDRLIELLEKAESIEDIITLESRLSEVRYQIESMEAQLRSIDNKVSYSTVYLNIDEVKKYTPVKEQTIGEKIVTGFMGNLYDIGQGLLDFGIGIVISVPYLVIWAIVILIAVLIIKGIIKKNKKKKQKELETLKQETKARETAVQETAVQETVTDKDKE